MTSTKERVIDTIRRAAQLTYVHGRSQMDLGELAAALGHDEITPATLAKWAEEDGWEEQRKEVHGDDDLLRDQIKWRRESAQKSLEALHNQAVRVQRILKPKTWEAAAGVQLRCAETLRGWADDDARRLGAAQDLGDAVEDAPGAVVTDAWRDMSDEDWQSLAHAALAKNHRSDDADKTAS